MNVISTSFVILLILSVISFLAVVITYYNLKIKQLRQRYEKTIDSLKEDHEIFELLMEFTPIYIFFKDENIRALKLSKNFENMLGMPVSKAIGKTMDDLFPSDFAKKMIQDDLKILNEEVPAELVEQFNGRTYITLKFPVKRAGKPKFMAGFTIDITGQKKIESDLVIAKQQAEAANKAKDIFLANMSHELRTPMNGIIGFLGLMETSGLNGRQKEYNEMIKASANHLLDLINDILDFSKLEAKNLKLESRPFDLVQAVKNSIDLILNHAEIKNLKLNLDLKSDINYKVKGDELRVKQIIINLLSNAVKFSSHGSVTVSVIEKCRQDFKSVISISVADTGKGIPADVLDNVFEMFVQIDDSASRVNKGAGLGLSIVKRLSEAMGGAVSLVSEEGKGSCFTVEIPFDIYFVSSSDAGTVKTDISNPAAGPDNFKRPLNLLLAEDDLINQKLMKAILTNLKWHAQIANNGIEAVELYKKHQFDAIIMDGQMPDMNGFDAAKAIRQIEKESGGHIPIIALTAYAMKGDREKFLAAGMDDYMTKPVSSERSIIEVLRKYVTD